MGLEQNDNFDLKFLEQYTEQLIAAEYGVDVEDVGIDFKIYSNLKGEKLVFIIAEDKRYNDEETLVVGVNELGETVYSNLLDEGVSIKKEVKKINKGKEKTEKYELLQD